MLFFLRVLTIYVLSSVAAVEASVPTVHEYTLKNGLKVLVKEDQRFPVVVSQVWYKVGSSYEYGGVTGISHILEHMMFKGTDKLKAGEFSRIIAENGGQENAFTGRDYTAYFQTLEKSRLPISFELEADRMRNLHLLKEEYDKELQVVLEERRMRTDDVSRSKLQEHFMAFSYLDSPYKNPVIGWPSDIENITVADLQSWYQQWYAPNNATVVIIGDVKHTEVFALAEKHFGPLKPSVIRPNKPQKEVTQLGAKRVSIKLPAKLPYLLLGYKVPVLNGIKNEWEAYALEVLAGVLDGGSSSRLSTRLVRKKQIANSAGAGYDLYARLPSMFMIDATPAQSVSLMDIEIALLDEVYDLQKNLVNKKEMEIIKAQVLANAIYERDSMFYQGMQLGMLETIGIGWQKAEEYVDKISAVTTEQVRKVAQKYLVEDQLNIAYLEPLPIQNKKPRAVGKISGGRHAQ